MLATTKIPRSCKWDDTKMVYACNGKNGTTYRDTSGISISKESMELKNKSIQDMLETSKKCIDDDKCLHSVDLTLFVLDSCPACKNHLPTLDNVVKKLSGSGIDVKLQVKHARENIKKFKKSKCTGTPCLVNDAWGKKIYDGNIGEVASMAQILGLPNPLFSSLKGKKPKNLVVKI